MLIFSIRFILYIFFIKKTIFEWIFFCFWVKIFLDFDWRCISMSKKNKENRNNNNNNSQNEERQNNNNKNSK